MLDVSLIRLDGGTQTRAEQNPNVVQEYAADMLTGAQFPPVVVFFDGAEYWLADGFHRVAAAIAAGLTEVAADVRQGTRRDAVLFSVGANASHGLRRTNADKRRAVEMLLNDDEWGKWSDNEIARRCGVSQPFVGGVRREIGVSYNDYKIATRNGTTYTVDTSNIGQRENLPSDAGADDTWGADTSDEGWDEPLTPYEEQMMQRYQERHTQPQSAVSVVHEAAASVEWYTPRTYLDAARAVMGGIDTDPASNDEAQQRVRAGTYYTIDDDGFHKPWRGRVWLNPPYGVENGKAVAGKWAARLIEQYDAGITTEAIVLVNAVIDSKWFNIFWRFPICFTDHRIRFELPPDAAQGANTSPVIGSAIVYLGSNVAAFVREFSQFGAVVARLHEYDGQVYSEVEHAANAA